jgi:hypothetical protein
MLAKQQVRRPQLARFPVTRQRSHARRRLAAVSCGFIAVGQNFPLPLPAEFRADLGVHEHGFLLSAQVSGCLAGH